MIYVDNTNEYSQRIYIPKDEADATSGVTGHTITLQDKDYIITQNGTTRIHADAGYDGISGGTIGVYVSAATGVTFEHLDVTEDGLYVPTGDSVYTGVTVQVYDNAYQDGYHNGYSDGYQSGYTRGHDEGYSEGYASGQTDGYASGSTEGFAEGYASGHTDGYQEGRGDGYNEGYASGHTDGYQEGREDGYSEGYSSGSTDGYAEGYQVGYAAGYTDGHSAGYQEGLAAGVLQQKALLTGETFTENGTFTRENGWSAVTINVSGGSTYESGYQDGIAYQKSLLGTYNFTATTGPTPIIFQDGISAATVNIPVQTYSNVFRTNGHFDYWAQDSFITDIHIDVDVPMTGATAVLTAGTFTQNGSYLPPAGVDGFSSVWIDVNTAATYNQGYEDGFSSGRTRGFSEGSDAQKGLLEATSLTANGLYTKANGWSAVTVDVPTASTYNSGYTSGYTDGTAYQKGLLSSTALTQNGTYTKANGWSAVTVNVPLTSTTITTNGTYTPSSGGYNRVTVNVPQTPSIVTMTQAQYNALAKKDNNTIYLIKN